MIIFLTQIMNLLISCITLYKAIKDLVMNTKKKASAHNRKPSSK